MAFFSELIYTFALSYSILDMQPSIRPLLKPNLRSGINHG